MTGPRNRETDAEELLLDRSRRVVELEARCVRAEEALRQIVDIPNTPLGRREPGWNYATFRNYALHLAEKALAAVPEEKP